MTWKEFKVKNKDWDLDFTS